MKDEEILELFFSRSQEAVGAVRQEYGGRLVRLAVETLPGTASGAFSETSSAAASPSPAAMSPEEYIASVMSDPTVQQIIDMKAPDPEAWRAWFSTLPVTDEMYISQYSVAQWMESVAKFPYPYDRIDMLDYNLLMSAVGTVPHFDQKGILYLMLNSVDYYDNAKVSFVHNYAGWRLMSM